MRSTSLPEELRELRDLGVLSDLDLELAAFVAELHDARGGQEGDAPERPGAAERPGAPAGFGTPRRERGRRSARGTSAWICSTSPARI